MDLKPFATRKFVAATATAVLMVACWVAAQWLVGVREYLSTLFTGLSAVMTAYIAGNVVQDHILTRKSSLSSSVEVEQVPDFVIPPPRPSRPE